MLEPIKKGKLAQRDYGYLNARVRAMSSALFNREGYQKLLELSDVKSMFSFLLDSEYGQDLREAEQKVAGTVSRIETFEIGLEANFHRVLGRLREMLDGEARKLFDLLLWKWDLQNIKTILRYKQIKASAGSFSQDFTFTGNLSRPQLDELSKADDVDAVINQLIAWGIDFVVPLLELSGERFGTQQNLVQENNLDKLYFAYMLKCSRKRNANYRVVNESFKAEIDKVNLMTALRLVDYQVDLERAKNFFIPGGDKIQEEHFDKLIGCRSLDDAFTYLERFSLRKIFESRKGLYDRIKDVAVYERCLEENIAGQLYRLYRRDMLGFGVILGYLRLKYDELLNLRIIGRAKEFGMPDEITRGELILVT